MVGFGEDPGDRPDSGTDRADRGTGRGGTSPEGPAGVDDPDPAPPEDDDDGGFTPPDRDGPPRDSGEEGGRVDEVTENRARTVEQSTTVGDRVRGGVDRVRSAGAEIQETLPGRTGEAAALGAGIAAVPEPTPVTEVTGATIAGGALLVGGGILASRAARNSELEVGDFTPDELEPGTRSRQEIREMEVTGSSGLGNSELDPAGAGVGVSELGVGSATVGSELDVSGGTSGEETASRPADDTVVPGDFPLPGRDIPRNPRRDAPSEPSPEDIAADTSATGTATGTGAGVINQPGPELPQPTREIGGGGGGFEAGRDFPSGASAVVGAEVARTEAAEAGNIVEQTEPGLFEEATGTPATDPLAPGGVGVGPAARADDLGFNDFGTATGTGIGTGTGVGTGTGTATGTGSATQTLLDPVFVTGQAQVNEQAIDEGIANENVFEEANPVETITPTGVSTGPPGRPRRPRRDRDGELNDEGDEFSIGFGGATFESPTQGLGEISEDLAEMFGGDNGP